MSRVFLICWLFSSPAFADSVGPESGSLVIVGGGQMTAPILREFFQRAGGQESPIVVIPTASVGEDWGPKFLERHVLTKAGAKNLVVLHTRDPAVANSEEFVVPLRSAKGVWIDGGRQWRLADSYLNTLTQREIVKVLLRGGVVGGTSAGATIQGSYLVRGAPEGNHILMAKGHEHGFGLLKNAAIDQHVLARKRENDLKDVIQVHPHLLGIGIDESTAIVVVGDRFKVIGASKVFIHHKDIVPQESRPYEQLSPGEEFDLSRRQRIVVPKPDESPSQ